MTFSFNKQNSLTAIVTLAMLAQFFVAKNAVAMPEYIISQSSSRRENTSQNNDYGAVTGQLQKIDDALQSQTTLSNTEYLSFRERWRSLCKSASYELSRGADASAMINPVESLDQELANRIREASQQNGSRKSRLEQELSRVELVYANRKRELKVEDSDHFSEMLASLRNRVEQKLSNLDDQTAEKFMREAHDIEAEIIDNILFKKNRHSNSSEQETSLFPKKEERSISTPMSNSTDRTTNGASEKASTSKDGSEQSIKPTSMKRPVKKALMPIPKIIERIENELMDYHDKKQIGSFDMDSFTDRLLKAKRNLHVMLSKTGRISARQEYVIRGDLEQLREDITNRVIGKD